MPTRLLQPGTQVLDANGAPVPGARLYTFEAGTSTPKITFSDAGGTVPNANPVVANAAGRFGDIFAAFGEYRLVCETAGGVPIWTADPVDGAPAFIGTPGAGLRNLLTDGDFSVVKKLTTTGVDGMPVADDWISFNQSNNTAAALQTLQQDGVPSNILITQSNASAQRFGIGQPIAAVNTYRTRGSNVTLSGLVRCSVAAPIRYAVLAWTGTADAGPSDFVNDWTSTSYTPGGFFLASNVAVVAVGVVTPSASVWTALPAITGAVTPLANNLAVMAWTEGAAPQNVALGLTQMQLEVSDTATAYEFLPGWAAEGQAQARSGFLIRDTVDDVWTRISDTAITAVASIDVLWAAGAYRALDVILTEIRPAATGTTANLMMRVRRSGSFVTGASAYHTEVLAQSGTSVFGENFDSSGWYLQRGGTGGTNAYSGRFFVDPALSGGDPGINGIEKHVTAAPTSVQRVIGGSMPSAGAIDGIRLFWESSVNFSAGGRVIVLGLKAL